jgi:hypothetical protein
MRARGEEIRQELENLRRRENNLADGTTRAQRPQSDAESNDNPAVLQADLEDRARKARNATIWLEVMLWVFEGARSLGLWLFVVTVKREAKRAEKPEPTKRDPNKRKGGDASSTANSRDKIPVGTTSVFDTEPA